MLEAITPWKSTSKCLCAAPDVAQRDLLGAHLILRDLRFALATNQFHMKSLHWHVSRETSAFRRGFGQTAGLGPNVSRETCFWLFNLECLCYQSTCLHSLYAPCFCLRPEDAASAGAELNIQKRRLFSSHGTCHLHLQPERRRGKNHHRGQPLRFHCSRREGLSSY